MPKGLKCNCKGDSANIHPNGKGVTLRGGVGVWGAGGRFAGPGCIKEEIIWERSTLCSSVVINYAVCQ